MNGPGDVGEDLAHSRRYCAISDASSIREWAKTKEGLKKPKLTPPESTTREDVVEVDTPSIDVSLDGQSLTSFDIPDA